VLVNTLLDCGFLKVVGRRERQLFNLWALATRTDLPDQQIKALAAEYFPA
jgi:hypothetical protein